MSKHIKKTLQCAIKRAKKLAVNVGGIRPLDIIILASSDDDLDDNLNYPIMINGVKMSRAAMVVNGRTTPILREYNENKDELFVWYVICEDDEWVTKMINYPQFVSKYSTYIHYCKFNKHPFDKLPLKSIKKNMTKTYKKYNKKDTNIFSGIKNMVTCGQKVIDMMSKGEDNIKLVSTIAYEMGIIKNDPEVEGLDLLKSVIHGVSDIFHDNEEEGELL